ncbi:MAG: cytochrome c-type biogenesis protein CcmH [Anaerolineales bacterium]
MKKHLLTLTLILIFSTLFTGIVFAQDTNPPTDDEVNAIAKQLYCPVCESTPLDVCPTEACHDWREQIRSMLAEGKSEDEILQYFTDQFGDKVRATPPARGLNWLVYVLPPIIILAGAIILFRALKAWTTPKVASAGTSGESSETSTATDDYVARLEEELKKRK